MIKKWEVSITDWIVAATLHKEGMSLKQIAERISRSVSTISDVIRRFKATEQFENSPRSGRPKISNATHKSKPKNRTASLPLLSTNWALTSGKPASSRTVRRRLQEAGYEARCQKTETHQSSQNCKKNFLQPCEIVVNWKVAHHSVFGRDEHRSWQPKRPNYAA